MSGDEMVIRFDKCLLNMGTTSAFLRSQFSVRRGMKVTLMGQNGAGKSTLFGLITGAIAPESGKISINNDLSIATAPKLYPEKKWILL